MLHFHTILYATDFSDPARNAFGVAYALARDYGARLLLVHVHELSVTAFGEYGMVPPAPDMDFAAVRTKLSELVPPDGPVPVEVHVRDGLPAEEIVELAEDQGVDLIVVGTHGRRGLERLLMGSVAEQIVRKAPCPVLTVKTPLPPEVMEENGAEEEVAGSV